ncbi:MAG TPA: prolipoprotein diacylglyceryl transferase [Actinophytocola sp.]|uniref:prolipoprotein diacylglyceryl transferase n=1 Tax=Actinophytocola sp. TaxID=1872138 RepID=UPI002DDCB016|nr:prolipoprotein diacylglyceryl transferase [Actinophytocola sp.]HEV2784015.1 prolipoprotein diacylglyceryl transferase [Actinophytocola sp.]
MLASFPSPDRGVWELGPIPIRAYALCIIVGIIVAIWWGERRFVARGGQAGTVIDVAVFAVPFGLVGGRLYHVATDWHRYFGEGRNPVDALRIWDGGLGIWGAIALGALGAWIGCRRKGVPLPAFADAVAPGIVVAQAIGRIGNYFNQELYGGPTDLPWGLEIYRRVNEAGLDDPLGGVAESHIPVQVVHPTFLYELLWNLAVAALVIWADRRFRLGHGRAFALYVAGYTAGRTWIELMRTDDATHIAGVRINVWVSAIVFIAAVAYFIWARRLGEREDLAALTAAREGEPAEPGAEAADTESDSETGETGTAEEAEADADEGAKAEEGEPADEEREKAEKAEVDSGSPRSTDS